MDDQQDFREYERSVKAAIERFIEKEFAGHEITIHGSRRYKGKSGTHQIDVSASGTIRGLRFFLIGECKCYKRKVGKGDVATFSAIKMDLLPNFAIMFTTAGFDSGAQEFATANGITLVKQRQQNGDTWDIVVPVAAIMSYLSRELQGRERQLTTNSLGVAPSRANSMNPIPTENQRPGTRSWINTNGRIDGKRRSTGIEGYCKNTSYRAGETVEICVSSAAPFVAEFYRLGFYGGDGARLIHQTPVNPGGKRNDPPIGDRQLRECDWPVSVLFTIPSDSVSGVYLGKLTEVNVPSPTGSYIIFVVRDNRSCDFLFKCSETTWSAYNAWPDDFSLYDFHGTPAKIGYWGPDVRVSFDRPYALSLPWYAIEEPDRLAWMIGASQFLTFEYPLLFWMESRGFDVSYMSCIDLHDSPPVSLRQRAKALLATGHDEYYSIPMHDNLSNAVQATDGIPENGLSVAFLCGGSMTGVTELAPSLDGNRQNRIIRRIGRWGPIDPWLMAAQPEQAGFTDGAFIDGGDLIGARLVEPAVGVGDWRCANTGSPLGSRVYNGTGLGDNDRIRGLIGHEFTGNPIGRPGLEILAEENLVGGDGQFIANKCAATIYPGPKGNLVFNASTLWWPQYLNMSTSLPFPSNGEPRFTWSNGPVQRDPAGMQAVERITLNLFGMFLA